MPAASSLLLNDMSDRIELSDGKPITKIEEAAILEPAARFDMKDVGRMRDAIKGAACAIGIIRSKNT